MYMKQSRHRITALAAFTFLFFSFYSWEQRFQAKFNQDPILHDGYAPNSATLSKYQPDCGVDITHMNDIRQRYNLDDTFKYKKRYIRFHRTDGMKRLSMTPLDQKLLPSDMPTVNLETGTVVDDGSTCDPPLEIDVTRSGLPQLVNASHMIFGVSTTYERLMDPATRPIDDWVYWLTDGEGNSNGGTLLLTLVDAEDEQLENTADYLRSVGIDAYTFSSDSSVEMGVRYLHLVPRLYNHPAATNRKWLVLCDDDTFFPSMHGLIERLSTLDHTVMLYIGTLSEDFVAVDRHGSQAFGGASVILSMPLANRISEHADDCQSESMLEQATSPNFGLQGDMLLRICIYQYSQTRMSLFRDLWQLDFGDDPSGFYEWGIKPLSLHHFRGGDLWHLANPTALSKIAYTCGEDCILQRFRTRDDFIFSSYSVAHYPYGINWDTDQVERTMRTNTPDSGWNFDYMFGPQRPSLSGTGQKIAWRMVESELKPDGSFVQTYICRHDDERWTEGGRSMSKTDSVIELVWISS